MIQNASLVQKSHDARVLTRSVDSPLKKWWNNEKDVSITFVIVSPLSVALGQGGVLLLRAVLGFPERGVRGKVGLVLRGVA